MCCTPASWATWASCRVHKPLADNLLFPAHRAVPTKNYPCMSHKQCLKAGLFSWETLAVLNTLLGAPWPALRRLLRGRLRGGGP